MLKVSRDLDRLLNALMTDSVIACDARGHMVYANLAAKSLFNEIDLDSGYNMDDCRQMLAVFDREGERTIDATELPLAQAAYEGKVVRINLLIRQGIGCAPVEATAFPVHDRKGRQIGAMMVCRYLSAFPGPGHAFPAA